MKLIMTFDRDPEEQHHSGIMILPPHSINGSKVCRLSVLFHQTWYLSCFFQGSPLFHAQPDGCGLHERWQSAYEAMLEPRWLRCITSKQWHLDNWTPKIGAAKSSINEAFDVISGFSPSASVLCLFLVMHAEPGEDWAAWRGNKHHWGSDQGHSFSTNETDTTAA